jgi:hypothetical protein
MSINELLHTSAEVSALPPHMELYFAEHLRIVNIGTPPHRKHQPITAPSRLDATEQHHQSPSKTQIFSLE